MPKSVVAKSLAEELMVFRERLRFAKTWDISVTHDGGYRLTRPGNVGLTGPGFSMVALFQGGPWLFCTGTNNFAQSSVNTVSWQIASLTGQL